MTRKEFEEAKTLSAEIAKLLMDICSTALKKIVKVKSV